MMEYIETSDPEFDALRDPSNLNREVMSTVGTPLAEVFSVIITVPDGKEYEIYGTIQVKDDKGSFYIYDCTAKYADCIDQTSNHLLLSSQDRAISAAYGRFTINLDLKDDKNVENATEFINESFSWEERDCYDKYISKNVVGKSGSATVNYIVHSVAVEGIITALFFKGDSSASDEQMVEGNCSSSEGESVTDESFMKIESSEQRMEGGDNENKEQPMKGDSSGNNDSVLFYGTLSAYYKKGFRDQKSDNFRISVFEEDFDTAMDVKDRHMLYLPRRIVSVPCYSSLAIEFELYGHIPVTGKQACWKGEVEFTARSFFGARDRKVIKGDYGVINLGVQWLHHYFELQDLEHWRNAKGVHENLL